jgi:hypothetical protein
MKYSCFFFFFFRVGMNKIKREKSRKDLEKPNVERHKIDTSDVDKADKAFDGVDGGCDRKISE